MASTKRTKSKYQTPFSAPDILGRSQNWVQKVSSIRLSNIRVGQHFTDVGQHLTNMLADKDTTTTNTNNQNPHKNSTKSDIFHPSFCKLLKLKHDGGSLIFVGGKRGVRIWRTHSLSHSECSTDLLYASSETDQACFDLCFSEESRNHTSSSIVQVVIYLLLASDSNSGGGEGRGGSGHVIRSLHVTGEISSTSSFSSSSQLQVTPLGDQHYEGTANSIACTNRFLLVSQTSTGTVHLLSRCTLQRVGEVPSLGPHRAVVLAASARWIAIQSKTSVVMVMST